MSANESMSSGPTLPPYAILAIEHNGFLELSRPARRPFGLRYPWLVKPEAKPRAAAEEPAAKG